MVSRRLTAFVSVGVLAGALLVGVGTAAHAVDSGAVPAVRPAAISDDERAQGLWYAHRLKFDELQAQGATGAGVKIAVIDAALNVDAAELQGANITIKGSYCASPDSSRPVPAVSDDVERSGHGTDVVAMLVGNGKAADGGPGTRGIVPDAEVQFYAIGTPDERSSQACEKYDPVKGALYDYEPIWGYDYWLGGADAFAAMYAIEDGVDIIVYSALSGPSEWERVGIAALRAGIPIVAGTPNPDGTLMRSELRGRTA